MGATQMYLSPKDYFAFCCSEEMIARVLEGQGDADASTGFVPTVSNGVEILMKQDVETIGLDAVKRQLGI